ncbi:hypothetical protein AC1031_020400 [Aphanomyces cochlioides]|nr:hypothetical protein AC1031_020400 [Aphanomyces cochlioides]
MGASDPPPDPPLANKTPPQPRPPAAPPDQDLLPNPTCVLSPPRHHSQRLRLRQQTIAPPPAVQLPADDATSTIPPATSQSSSNHTEDLSNGRDPPPPRHKATADPASLACQAQHPPSPPSSTNPPGSWLDETYPQTTSPTQPFREHQHQRLFPLFQRPLPLLFPLFTSLSHTLSASPPSPNSSFQPDVPPASTPPPAQEAQAGTPWCDEDVDSGSSKRVAPITPPVAAPSTLPPALPAPTPTRAPTPHNANTMADTHQDEDMQEPEPHGTSQDQQPSGASHSPKRPGLEKIQNDAIFWDAEDELFPVLTDEEINNIETAFAQSTNTLLFHLNPDDASRYNILNFREEITSDCKYFFNITFPMPLTGSASVLMGTPNECHIETWSVAERGYMLLPKAMIMVSYQHAANTDPPLSLNQLEYSNTDYMSPNDLRKVFRALGAPDYIVCSHSRNGDNTRRTERWPSIGCIKRRTDKLFKFRVMFPNQALTELVYANYHALRRSQGTHEDVPNSLQLRPLSELHWDQPSQIFYNPVLPSNSHLRDTKLRLSLIPPTIRAADIAIVLAEQVFDKTDVDITDTVATITLQLRNL